MQEFVNSRTGATSERCLLVRAKIHLLLMTMQLLLSGCLGARWLFTAQCTFCVKGLSSASMLSAHWEALFVQSAPFVFSCVPLAMQIDACVLSHVVRSLFARPVLLLFCSYIYLLDSNQMLTIATSPWQIGLLVWPQSRGMVTPLFLHLCVLHWRPGCTIGHSQPRYWVLDLVKESTGSTPKIRGRWWNWLLLRHFSEFEETINCRSALDLILRNFSGFEDFFRWKDQDLLHTTWNEIERSCLTRIPDKRGSPPVCF